VATQYNADDTSDDTVKKSWVDVNAGNLNTFIAQVSQQTELAQWPLASAVEQNLLVYQGDDVRKASQSDSGRNAMMFEWARALSEGPGIIAIQNAMPDHDNIDEVNALFTDIINDQRRQGANTGDHFAKPGANDRVWNALEKHCVANPKSFVPLLCKRNDRHDFTRLARAWLSSYSTG